MSEGERHAAVNLGPSESAALAELAKLRGESQGSIVGALVVAALRRERKRGVSG